MNRNEQREREFAIRRDCAAKQTTEELKARVASGSFGARLPVSGA
jgi:hypothetical protein